jgi:Zn-dependent protease with chaperone function
MSNPTIPAASRPCPTCSADVPADSRFVEWCAACGWNVRPHQPEIKGVLAKIYAALGRRSSQHMLARMQGLASLQPRLSLSLVAAWLVSALVHLLSLGCLAAGLYLLIAHWPNIFAIIFGALLLLIAWALRPRQNRLDDDETVLSRAEYPQLYALSDSVAAAIKAPPLDGIVINETFNAWFGRFGWRRRRVMALGLPLWVILTAEERVSLVGHELGHSVNGDASRSFFVYSAVRSLTTWSQILRPAAIWDRADGWIGFLAIPLNLILLGVARLAWLSAYGLMHLLWRNKQRSEYLADYLAAQAGGTAAALSVLHKMHLGPSCHVLMQRIALGNPQADMFGALRDHIHTIPERELERLRRVELLVASRLDTTHPPTPHLIQFLQAHPVASARVSLSAEQNAAIDAELSRLQAGIQKKIIIGFTNRF